MAWSITSMAAGTMPSAMIALTVVAASRTEANDRSRVRTSGGFLVSFTATLVAMPRVPSLPMNAPRRSSPAGSASSPPSIATWPDGSTASMATTCASVTPYARQCGPPELLATFPPIVQTC